MNNLLELPKEILNIIFSNLKKEDDDYSDIRQCALTCRAWRQTAREVIFHTVVIKKKGDLKKIAKILKHDSSLGGLVKKVKYSSLIPGIEDHASNLPIFDKIFPSLQELVCTSTDDHFMKTLYRLLLDGKFPRLKILHLPHYTRYTTKMYILCLELLKDRITSMTLKQDYSYFVGITYELLSNKLGRFTKLESLTLHLFGGEKEKRLRKVEYFLTFKSNTNTGLRENIHPISHVKDLSITCNLLLPAGYNNNTLYLMKKFPNLRTLSLDTDCRLQDADVRNDFNKVNLEFIKYINRIPNHSLNSIIITDVSVVGDIVRQYFENSDSSQRRMYPDTLILDRENHKYGIVKKNLAMGFNNDDTKRKNVMNVTLENAAYLSEYVCVLQQLGACPFRYLQYGNSSLPSTIETIQLLTHCFPHITHLRVKGPVRILAEQDWKQIKHDLDDLEIDSFSQEKQRERH